SEGARDSGAAAGSLRRCRRLRALRRSPPGPDLGILLDGIDRPEVLRQVTAGEVRVGHRAVALLTPSPPPRAPYREALRCVVVADGEHGVAPDLLLLGAGHRHHPRHPHLVALE